MVLFFLIWGRSPPRSKPFYPAEQGGKEVGFLPASSLRRSAGRAVPLPPLLIFIPPKGDGSVGRWVLLEEEKHRWKMMYGRGRLVGSYLADPVNFHNSRVRVCPHGVHRLASDASEACFRG